MPGERANGPLSNKLRTVGAYKRFTHVNTFVCVGVGLGYVVDHDATVCSASVAFVAVPVSSGDEVIPARNAAAVASSLAD